MTAVTKQQQEETQAVARPLKVLVPLIKQDIEAMEQTVDKIVSPYYLSIGEKLLEANKHTSYGNWEIWLKESFKISRQTAFNYMDYAQQANVKPVLHLSYANYLKARKQEAKLKQKTEQAQAQPSPAAWAEAWKRKGEQEVAKRQVRENQRELFKKVFNLGYKEMAKKLHPDKGGTNEGMHQLQEVKQLLARVLQMI
jgi:hypothetical protein